LPELAPSAFISYSREDSEFAFRLAKDLKAAGARVWLDQLDIKPGVPWDNAIEDALMDAPQVLIVLSPASARSENVRNEISYALEQGKIIIPVLYVDCVVPLRLQRTQRIDFRADYAVGLTHLLRHLNVAQPDPAIIQKAAESDAQRQTAWQAREADRQAREELRRKQEADAPAAEEYSRRQAADRDEQDLAKQRESKDEAARIQKEQHKAEQTSEAKANPEQLGSGTVRLQSKSQTTTQVESDQPTEERMPPVWVLAALATGVLVAVFAAGRLLAPKPTPAPQPGSQPQPAISHASSSGSLPVGTGSTANTQKQAPAPRPVVPSPMRVDRSAKTPGLVPSPRPSSEPPATPALVPLSRPAGDPPATPAPMPMSQPANESPSPPAEGAKPDFTAIQNRAALLYNQKNYAESRPLLDQACTGGYELSCVILGHIYEYAEGVPKDYAKASALYSKACDGGNAIGCDNLGMMYFNGRMLFTPQQVAPDYAKALALYSKACDGGNANGCYNLGTMYTHANGVARDDLRASQLYSKACDGGVRMGCNDLGKEYLNGKGVQKDLGKARTLFQKGCSLGLAEACFYLRVLR
jgi:hypothetical protein